MAEAVMVRVNKSSHRLLRQLSKAMGESMQDVLAKALEEYERKQFFEQLNASFTSLREDASAWKDELDEREAMAGSLSAALDNAHALPNALPICHYPHPRAHFD